MKTIAEEVISELEIKKSKFITILIPLEENDISLYLEEIKKKYPNATHYCYAYRFLGYAKCSDDGEPSRTAGMPILNVLEKEDIDCCLCVVVRYFGGIKLGAGGLVRAYSDATSRALQSATRVSFQDGYLISLVFSYPEEKEILYLLQKSKITEKTYDTMITYQVIITEEIKALLDARRIPYKIITQLKIRG